MRTVASLAVFPILLLSQIGCVSSWELRETLPETCSKVYAFYQDADGDGWGDPDSEAVWSCADDAVSGYNARNALDCDDDDADTTGRTDAICPDALTWDAPTPYVGSTYAGSEYVVVYGDDTELLSGLQAEISCEAWGGGLAGFDSFTEVDEALTESLSGIDGWAGFVEIGVVDGGWGWLDGSTASLDDIGWCSGEPEVPTDTEDADNARIALIFDGSAYCLGLPDEASDGYTPWEGHFVCERTEPVADDYAVPGILSSDYDDTGATGDTGS